MIVHGDAAALSALTTRHHVQVLRRLDGGAVVAANSAEIDELAADSAYDHLSGDPLVQIGMSISNQATAADQVRAGVAGGLLGLGAIPGVNGQGIGVAVVDSGISPHAALVNKVVANVSLITGDPVGRRRVRPRHARRRASSPATRPPRRRSPASSTAASRPACSW